MPDSIEKTLAKAIGAAQQQIRKGNIEEWKNLLQTSLNDVKRYRSFLLQYQQDVKNAQNGIKGRKALQEIRKEQEKKVNQWIFDNYDNSLIANTIQQMQNYLFNSLLALYAQINTIREVLTGEKVTYQIAISYRGTIVEGSFTLEELVPYLKRDLTSAADYTIKIAKKTELINIKDEKGESVFKSLKNQELFNAILQAFSKR